jgi:iron complex outermembrane receptor protein
VFSESSEWTLQAYYDRTERGSDIRNTVDLDFQHRFRLGERQVVVWGAGFRHMQDRNSGSFDGELVPERRRVDLFSAFIQDEIVLVPKRLTLTLGTKFEHNDFTGVEVQPSGRLLWTPADRHTVWASVSRAVRTPSRGEDDLILRREPVYPAGAFFPGSPSVVTSLTGNREFESEELLAYELGYRVQPHERFSVDIAAFYNQYEGLRSFAPADPLVDFQSSIPTIRGYAINGLEGETYGGEISATWHATDWWRLRAHYSLLFTQIHQASLTPDLSTEAALEGTSPQQQFLLRSSLDLSRSIELDSTLRYVDSLPALALQSYLVVDVRLGWRASENVELSVVGQNLFRSRHEEFKSSFVPVATSEVETGIYGKVTIRF